MSLPRSYSLGLVFTLLAPLGLWADLVIPASTRLSSFDLGDLEPGETVYLEAQNREHFVFSNIEGTAENPIVITNSGGAVVINNLSGEAGMIFLNCRHFILRGDYIDGGSEYGIQILGTLTGSGIDLREGTTNFEISDLEIGNTSFAGIIAKSDELKRPDWVMEDVSIHDCYIHDTEGEGLYIGSSFFHSQDSHEIHGLRIYNNRIERAGWDGLQVGCATQDVEIYHNVVDGYGVVTNDPVQNEGFRLNPGTSGLIYGNTILNGTGTGIFTNPYTDIWIYNNLIANAAETGIYIADDAALVAGSRVLMAHNTIVNTGGDGFQFRSLSSADNLAQSNFVVNPGGEYFNRRYSGVDVTEVANLYLETVAEAGFLDADNLDFRLLVGSFAVDGGLPVEGFSISTDLAGNPRSSGALPDAGAYEYSASGETPQWVDWDLDEESGWVSTGSFLGYLYVEFDPWVWSFDWTKWVYLPEAHVSSEGAWTYVPR